MAAQKGKLVRIKISNSDSPETFSDLGGMRSESISIGDEVVDITDKDSTGRWGEMLRAGIRSATMSGEGLFKDAASETTLKNNVMTTADTIINFQFFIPDFGTFEGPFVCTTLSYSGDYDGVANYSMEFTSAGTITFTAV